MENIKVKRDELLKTVTENRDEHRKIFLEAQDGYRRQVIEELDIMLKDAREGRKIRRSIALVEPSDHTKDYDRVIRMIEMNQAELIELSEYDFQAYVMDEWDWSRASLASNSAYSVRAARMSATKGY